ncbi:ribonuclease T [Salipiger sp. CCB-MM3]|uniref:ribonuclease T2 family protein n=1 Tax=Salipiger sp. CCB-MM3 TaxID=1792508 RepID=UPI00080AB0CA|nr:ribonuclease T2 [Salipiger sp. CCB-MM3]ANT62145.1 ribonuclease T [Salipiger sp. CCB-MM3]
MRALLILLACAVLAGAASPARADGERAGRFDYYVLSLSWSPTWCALEGEARNSPQCDRALGWVLHGLWPQYERGYPSYCDTSVRAPSRAETAAMADIMGTPGLAWYQWKKHGSCAGLPAEAYFALARRAYEAVKRPEVLRRLEDPVTLPAQVIEEAFLKANPGLEPDMLTITCQAGRIQEARLCLSKDLDPVPCGRDVVKDCSLKDALLDPIR